MVRLFEIEVLASVPGGMNATYHLTKNDSDETWCRIIFWNNVICDNRNFLRMYLSSGVIYA